MSTVIAQEILRQIKNGSDAKDLNRGGMLLACWGATKFTALPEEKRGNYFQNGGLRFKVSGQLFKGLVYVRLMGNDTYTLDFVKPSKAKDAVNGFKVHQSIEDVYCDCLTSFIDSYVESGQ